jgi:hypothetical protein
MITFSIENFHRVTQKRYLATLGYFQIHMSRVCPNVCHENITLWLAIEIYSQPVSTANGNKFSLIKMSDRLEICLFIVRPTRSYL